MNRNTTVPATTGASSSTLGNIDRRLYRHLILTDSDEHWGGRGTWGGFKLIQEVESGRPFGQRLFSGIVSPTHYFPVHPAIGSLNYNRDRLAWTKILDVKSCCGHGEYLPPLPLPSLEVVRILKQCSRVHDGLPMCNTLIIDGKSEFKVNLNPSRQKRLVITLPCAPGIDISKYPLFCMPLIRWSGGGYLEQFVLLCKGQMDGLSIMYLAYWLVEFLHEVRVAGIILGRVVLLGVNRTLFNYAGRMWDIMAATPNRPLPFNSGTERVQSHGPIPLVFTTPDAYADNDREWLSLALGG